MFQMFYLTDEILNYKSFYDRCDVMILTTN